jgi:2-oxoglutarate ferredoxin oxidoreductase subunit alpha
VRDGTETLAWRLGGPQGSGINRIARFFARACAEGGLEVFCRREYHSNIMGRHSYNDVSIGAAPLACHRESTDILVTFDVETLCRHILTITDSGYLVYAEDDADIDLNRIAFLDTRLRNDIGKLLEANGLPLSTAGLLQLAQQRGVRSFAVPYKQLLSDLADESGLSRQSVAAAINTLAVSASAALMNISEHELGLSLVKAFAGRADVINMNRLAIAIAYRYVEQHFGPLDLRLQSPAARSERLLVNATQGVALGKLAAGMSFQSYYPISPATDESTFLESHCQVALHNGKEGGPLLFQAEDELAAVNMASGAALTGARSATSTSGPGFSLMAEGLGWAGMNEVPLVVTLYQRGGPSTGMPTRTDQGDLQFALHAGHGEFPRMVLASADVEACFYDAAQAFDYAERYQLPVIHLLDKAMTSTLQTVPVFDMTRLHIERGELQPDRDEAGSVPRFSLTESGISARPLLRRGGGRHWLTGVEHNEKGQVSEDPVLREQMMEKRARKLLRAAAEIPLSEKFEIYGDEAASFTIITWGSNKGALIDALQRLKDEGIKARAVQLRLLWPFPAEDLAPVLESASPSIMVECNYSGQMNALLREQTGHSCDHLIVKYSGRPISGESLFPVLKAIHAGQAEPRIVLRNPYE